MKLNIDLKNCYGISELTHCFDFTTSTQNQTIELLKEYKNRMLGTPEEVEKLEQVNLITPENIHLNSFMYEPILDMGSSHLRALYTDVKTLA
ncbi:hypothetical protein [Burkholderia pyrrocinia]|uniref:hypothetical protein n=1 Tax=Burkholderia pyrrocinia TaxID=60550 RepID=UPI00158CB0A3|nr:hypothetical protein [Burkholderia pyrrocinia]